jgi:hypothetical protein
MVAQSLCCCGSVPASVLSRKSFISATVRIFSRLQECK